MSLRLAVNNVARDCEDVVYELLSNGHKLTVPQLEERCAKLAYNFTKEIFHNCVKALIDAGDIAGQLDENDCITYLKYT